MKTIINEARKKGKFLLEFDTKEELLAAKSLLTTKRESYDLWLKVTTLEAVDKAREHTIKTLQERADFSSYTSISS